MSIQINQKRTRMDSETVLEPQNRSERIEIHVFRPKIIEKITKIKISETYGPAPPLISRLRDLSIGMAFRLRSADFVVIPGA